MNKILIALLILSLLLIVIPFIFLFYALMNIDIVKNVKGDISYVVNQLADLSIKIAFAITIFVILLLSSLTFLITIAIFSKNDFLKKIYEG